MNFGFATFLQIDPALHDGKPSTATPRRGKDYLKCVELSEAGYNLRLWSALGDQG